MNTASRRLPRCDDACLARPIDTVFHELGTRVPLLAISPWARRHFVSHARKEHTSITRLIEAVFDLPALTARDANSDALLDMFDFGCVPAPVASPPAPGVGGCRGSENHAGDWPLRSGHWVAWFLISDGYTSVASAEFTVL